MPADEWLPGKPPEGIRLPIDGCHEERDPAPDGEEAAAMKAVRADVSKWKRKQPPIVPGSLEDQIEKLRNTKNILLDGGGDAEDLLAEHDREWYESKPYLNVLRWMAENRHGGTRFAFVTPETGAGMSLHDRILHILDVGGMLGIEHGADPCELNPPGEERRVAFLVSNRGPEVWEFDEPQKGITDTMIRRYAAFLNESTFGGTSLYELPYDGDARIIAAFHRNFIDQVNAVLPIPFKPVMDA